MASLLFPFLSRNILPLMYIAYICKFFTLERPMGPTRGVQNFQTSEISEIRSNFFQNWNEIWHFRFPNFSVFECSEKIWNGIGNYIWISEIPKFRSIFSKQFHFDFSYIISETIFLFINIYKIDIYYKLNKLFERGIIATNLYISTNINK